MISWNTTRNFTAYSSYSSSGSVTNVGGTTYSDSLSYSISQDSKTVSTGESFTSSIWFNSSFSFTTFSISTKEIGFTSSSGGTTVSKRTDAYVSDFTATETYTYSASGTFSHANTTIVTSTTTNLTATYNTSSTYTTTGSVYTSSADSAGNPALATKSVSITTTGTSTTTGIYYYTDITHTIFPVTAPMEVGTIYMAENSEWVWSFSGTPAIGSSDSNIYLLSDVANSFKTATFWPSYITSVISIISLADSAVSSSFIVINSSEDSITWASYDQSYTTVSTVTTGQMLPAQTTTVGVTGYSSVTYSDVVHYISSATISAYATTTSTNSDAMDTTAIKSVFLTSVIGGTVVDNELTTITALTQTTKTYTSTIQNNQILVAYGSNFTYGKGITSVFNAYITAYSTINYATIYEPIPKWAGMQAPFAMAQNDNTGTNIMLSPAIFYPFRSSVLSNVVVPVVTNTTTTQIDPSKSVSTTSSIVYGTYTYTYVTPSYTGITRWIYSWVSDTLNYTSATSTTTINNGKTVSVFNTTSSTAVFGVDGNNTGNYVVNRYEYYNISAIIGGYSPISSKSQTAFIDIQAADIVKYDTNGASTNTNTVWESSTVSSIKQTVQVNLTAPAYITFTQAGLRYPVTEFSTG